MHNASRAVALTVVALVVVAACGGSSGSSLAPDTLDHDASAAFAGSWYGTVTLTINGQTQSTSTQMDVTVTARNALTFPGFCGDGSGPSARVTSDTAFTVASHGCPIPTGSCTISWQIDGGSGSLQAGALDLSVSGPMSGCNAPAGTSLALSFHGTKQAGFHVTFLSPPSVDAGSAGFTLQVNGSGFPGDAVVLWNGSPRATTAVSASVLQAQIAAGDVATAGWAQVAVTSASAGATSSPLAFQIVGQSAPYLYSINPSSGDAGSGALTLQVTGGGFTSGAIVQWNGSPRTTTFVNSSVLQAQITAADVAVAGTAQVTVANGPGGAPSSPLPFQILAPQAGVTILSLPARDMVWDPVRQKIYVSLDNTSPTNPNTITTLDPFTGTFDAGVFAGSQPGRLALSDDGQFLYVGLDGSAAVQRFALPAFTPDVRIPLGSDSFFGAYRAGDVAVAPGAPRTIAVSLFASSVSPAAEGGVVIFDDATARTTRAHDVGSLYDSVQWGADATALYAANNESTGFDFYTLSVNAAGVTLAHDYWNAFSTFGNRIHFDPVTRLVYSDDGHVVDPATGNPAGTFGVSGRMIPDGTGGVAVFVTTDYSSTSTATVRTFDLTRFTPLGTFVVQRLSGQPAGRVLRWGTDGIAFITGQAFGQGGGQLVLTHYPHP